LVNKTINLAFFYIFLFIYCIMAKSMKRRGTKKVVKRGGASKKAPKVVVNKLKIAAKRAEKASKDAKMAVKMAATKGASVAAKMAQSASASASAAANASASASAAAQ
jgi:glycerol-3-phosphate dehydrogenase